MGHNLIVPLQFPKLIFSASAHLRTHTTSTFHHHTKKKQTNSLCFALNGNPNPPLFVSLGFSRSHPLSESLEASFDEYIEDEARVLTATFAGKSKRLHQDEWRVQMPSFQLLFFTISPIADVRVNCRSSAEDYPIHIPPHISKFLELQLMRWEVKGLGRDLKSQSIKISLRGALYAERRESKSLLRNYLVLNLHNLAAPTTPLLFIPQDVFQALAQKALKGMMEEAMDEFTENLLLDYNKFKKEKQKNEVPANCG